MQTPTLIMLQHIFHTASTCNRQGSRIAVTLLFSDCTKVCKAAVCIAAGVDDAGVCGDTVMRQASLSGVMMILLKVS